ncbi:MAG: cysteine desulfurase-like protein [Thermoanaerobaculia bacterium]
MSETLTSRVASTEAIRASFPALQRTHNGLPVAYFDGPGGTQVPRQVADAITDYLFHHNANTHWVYPSSQETDAVMSASRAAMADFLGCSAKEVVFGANMTTLTFHLARALGRTWSAGDEVVVTDLDHHANIAPWRALERDRGIVVRAVRMNRETVQLDYDHLAQLTGPKTRLVAVGGASNATGTINDIARAAAIARGAGALVFVDAVHYAPHELMDVRAVDCDFMACSSYKFYGPHAGILFAREELLSTLPFPKLDPSPDYAPDRAETGTQNHEGIAGIGATVDFLASLAGAEGTRRERLAATYSALHERGRELTQRLWDGLTAIRGVKIYGPKPGIPRTPTVSFTLDGVSPEQICRDLAARAVFASNGDFYASTVVERFGLAEGLVRIGCAAYTTREEVDRVIEGVERAADRR